MIKEELVAAEVREKGGGAEGGCEEGSAGEEVDEGES